MELRDGSHESEDRILFLENELLWRAVVLQPVPKSIKYVHIASGCFSEELEKMASVSGWHLLLSS
jgi:hypothetical protein